MEVNHQINQPIKIVKKNRPMVQLGFYIFLLIFLFSFFGSVVVIIMLCFTQEKIHLDINIPDVDSNPSSATVNAEIPLIGKFGATSTAIILVGTPLFTLATLLAYCHLFNYRPY